MDDEKTEYENAAKQLSAVLGTPVTAGQEMHGLRSALVVDLTHGTRPADATKEKLGVLYLKIAEDLAKKDLQFYDGGGGFGSPTNKMFANNPVFTTDDDGNLRFGEAKVSVRERNGRSQEIPVAELMAPYAADVKAILAEAPAAATAEAAKKAAAEAKELAAAQGYAQQLTGIAGANVSVFTDTDILGHKESYLTIPIGASEAGRKAFENAAPKLDAVLKKTGLSNQDLSLGSDGDGNIRIPARSISDYEAHNGPGSLFTALAKVQAPFGAAIKAAQSDAKQIAAQGFSPEEARRLVDGARNALNSTAAYTKDHAMVHNISSQLEAAVRPIINAGYNHASDVIYNQCVQGKPFVVAQTGQGFINHPVLATAKQEGTGVKEVVTDLNGTPKYTGDTMGIEHPSFDNTLPRIQFEDATTVQSVCKDTVNSMANPAVRLR